MPDITTKTFLSNVKKSAKAIKKNDNICHAQALDRAARTHGFDSYHALKSRIDNINNESNIVNSNLGSDGVNDQYAKAQGNRGKQLNPNQKSSLLVVFNDDLMLYRCNSENGELITVRGNFQTEYLDKGFAEDIGARQVSLNELKHRSLQAPGGKLGEDFLHNWGYTCIEFLRNKDNPWSIEDANQLVIERVKSKIGQEYREFFYLDGEKVDNHIGDEMSRYLDLMDAEPEYHPAIDGY
ncbi:hypothetical protein PE36_08121 [Moritella sp. PE36]|uniref:hypothetical protein n=1 Tax=Moritella sp. PE36 TaxID=58051 RepID=UPI0001568DC4|nr:hypothetical protein [Moritella sp. PE36]EDM65952.1 hypothetical protein PE36_08121 [Moritella sp. PE36]